VSAGLPQNLVIVGPDAWGLDPLGHAERLGCRSRVHWIDHAPMDDLAHLYQGARAFVLPTEHEGFSLTIVEAMACGTPAIVFDHPGLEGAVRDAALVADASSLAHALSSIALDNETAHRLRRQGLECASRYRWGDAADKTMAVICAAAQSQSR
jgi:alpha-1,3-rhamnosyl/mannosyltransferase